MKEFDVDMTPEAFLALPRDTRLRISVSQMAAAVKDHVVLTEADADAYREKLQGFGEPPRPFDKPDD